MYLSLNVVRWKRGREESQRLICLWGESDLESTVKTVAELLLSRTFQTGEGSRGGSTPWSKESLRKKKKTKVEDSDVGGLKRLEERKKRRGLGGRGGNKIRATGRMGI